MGIPKFFIFYFKEKSKSRSSLSFLPFHSHLHWSKRTHFYCETQQQVDPWCPSLIKLTKKPSKIPHTWTNVNKYKTNPASQIEKTNWEIDLSPCLHDPTQPKDPTLRSTPLSSTPITRNTNLTHSKSHQNQKIEKPNWTNKRKTNKWSFCNKIN